MSAKRRQDFLQKKDMVSKFHCRDHVFCLQHIDTGVCPITKNSWILSPFRVDVFVEVFFVYGRLGSKGSYTAGTYQTEGRPFDAWTRYWNGFPAYRQHYHEVCGHDISYIRTIPSKKEEQRTTLKPFLLLTASNKQMIHSITCPFQMKPLQIVQCNKPSNAPGSLLM